MQQNEVVFYTNPMSRGRIVRWMLEEIGEPYRTELLEYGTTMKSPAFLAINPMGKVPAIQHGNVAVSECAAICAYLADAFPEADLAPAVSSPLRGTYYRWLFFGAGPVESAIINTALNVVVPEGRERMVGYGSLDQVLDLLENTLSESDYLVGGKFSAADLYVGSQLGWAMGFGIIPARKVLQQYCDRLQARPAARRAKEIDEALMPEAQQEPA